MLELYVFIFALIAITAIVMRRNVLFDRKQKREFKEKVKTRVDELRKEQQKVQPERFKEKYVENQKGKVFDIAKYKEDIRKGEMAIAKEKWSDAKKYLVNALAVAKDEMPVSLLLAKVYKESGDTRRAETLYKRLLEIDDKVPEIYESLAQMFVKKKRYKEAIEMYSRALELDEKNEDNMLGLGRLYDLLMRPSLAAECYRRVAELKPREVNYLFLLAEACEKDDDFDNALFTYEKVLTLEPYNERAKDRSQDVRVKINEFESSMKIPVQSQ